MVYAADMRRPLLNLLMVFALLLQGVGSAWAATRMAAGEVQVAAHVAELPPCHQEAAKVAVDGEASAMNCCGTGACHCAMSCGALPALALLLSAALFARQAEAITEGPQHLLAAPHYGPPLRPPATLQS